MSCNQRTSDVIFRYLRHNQDFLSRHLRALPFKNFQKSHVLNQINYLLKSTAIEIKIAASNSQTSRLKHLCEILFGTSAVCGRENVSNDLTNFYSHASQIFAENPIHKKVGKDSNILMCTILDCIVFHVKPQPLTKWNFFDGSLMNQIISECEIKTSQSHTYINIKKLHDILNEELKIVQSTIASGQRKLILEEIEDVLMYAVALNNERSIRFATINLMDAWGQVCLEGFVKKHLSQCFGFC